MTFTSKIIKSLSLFKGLIWFNPILFPRHMLTQCHWRWHVPRCRAVQELTLLILFAQRRLHKCLVTRESITSTTYLNCLHFSLIFEKYLLLSWITISNVNNFRIIMSIIITTLKLNTEKAYFFPKILRKGEIR